MTSKRVGCENAHMSRTLLTRRRLLQVGGLGLLGIGILSLPLAVLRGRRAMMDSLIRAARGAGRIAAEFHLHYEQYR